MGLVFDRKDIKIKFLSKDIFDTENKKKLIVFPLLVYKLQAPSIEDLDLNIFQKHVLSILNKQVISRDKISKYLCLDIILVNTILRELANKSLIDYDSLVITEKGKELIKGAFSWFNNQQDLKTSTQYTIQNPFTKKLLPIIFSYERLTENFKSLKNEIIIKTIGKEEAYPFELITPSKHFLNNYQEPKSKELLTVFSKCVKRYLPNSKDDIKKIPDAVRVISPEPELIFAGIWVNASDNSKEVDELEYNDPFELTEDTVWLKEVFEESLKHSQQLKKVLDSLIIDLSDSLKVKIDEAFKRLSDKNENDVRTRFDVSFEVDYPLVYDIYKEFSLQILQVKSGNNVAFGDVVKKCQNIMETLFTSFYNKNTDDYKSVLSSTRFGSRNSVETAVLKAKLRNLNPNIQIPDKNSIWIYQNYNDIKKGLQSKASLRALFGAAILVAHSTEKHLLRKILKEKDDFPKMIEEIAIIRNLKSHGNNKLTDEQKNKLETIIKYIDEVIEIVIA